MDFFEYKTVQLSARDHVLFTGKETLPERDDMDLQNYYYVVEDPKTKKLIFISMATGRIDEGVPARIGEGWWVLPTSHVML